VKKLSIIIVSYNVVNFLERCLLTVEKAAQGIGTEIFVVDNNSPDGSADMVAKKFPGVNLIRNLKNIGFSKANNQALPYVRGEYVLFLNPDTLVDQETFTKCIEFMDAHPGAGAMGVKMNDGKGRYLPESKRSIPTPLVAFYKISGLTALFPRSKIFGKYYLGHLDKGETHEIEVLTGAFFFARKAALDKAGWFDEDFFMYGEDIDLSLRILKNGYRIWYYPETSIIHYKGESTRKSSINYVLIFYRAMIIYSRKHFDTRGAFLLLWLLHVAIWFRAGLSIVRRLLGRMMLPALDAAAICTGYLLIPSAWEERLSFSGPGYPEESRLILIPALIIVWIVSIYLSGGYKDPPNIYAALRGLLYGSLAILIVYAMLSTGWYVKIATILPLAIMTALVAITVRMILLLVKEPGRK
jgi:O-antigen biosynthesis protein